MIYLDPERRTEALAAISQSVGVPIAVGSEWEVFAVVSGSRVVGGALRKGREIHLGVNEPVYFRPILRWLKGDSVTVVRETHEKGRAFVTRLGFVETGRKDGLVMYEMKGLRHV